MARQIAEAGNVAAALAASFHKGGLGCAEARAEQVAGPFHKFNEGVITLARNGVTGRKGRA